MAAEVRLPKLKFCGLTRTTDVIAAIEAGADAIGLNFYERSPRYVTPSSARHLSEAARGSVLRVGVFVNATPSQVDAVVSVCPLDCIQLHGDEQPRWIDEALTLPSLQSMSFIKAVAWRGTEEDRQHVLDWSTEPNARLLGLLVDAFDPIQRGGTGKTARWDLLYPRPAEFGSLRILLAGGLTVENIAQALEIARPDGVDIASGIEIAPGIKDKDKMQRIADEIQSI
jgi:phosphoribosylanthranilate isomerase